MRKHNVRFFLVIIKAFYTSIPLLRYSGFILGIWVNPSEIGLSEADLQSTIPLPQRAEGEEILCILAGGKVPADIKYGFPATIPASTQSNSAVKAQGRLTVFIVLGRSDVFFYAFNA